MHLVLDVGNTETVLGVFDPGSLEVTDHWSYATGVPRSPDEIGLMIGGLLGGSGLRIEDVARVVIGSVVPAHTDLLLRTLTTAGEREILVVEGLDGLPIRLEVDEPSEGVGADRIANTLAASRLYARDTIVVDFGTATTYDCISADGVFLGGVIAPGIMAGEEWLAGRTAKLPRVAFGPPDRVIGKRTETCLQSGVFFSVVDGVDGVVARISSEWNTEVYVVATGGHAHAVAPHTARVEHVEPHLTLVGLELAGEHLASQAS